MDNDYKAMYEREKKSRIQAQIDLEELNQDRNRIGKEISIIHSEVVVLKNIVEEKEQLFLDFKQIAEDEINRLVKYEFLFKVCVPLLIAVIAYIWR